MADVSRGRRPATIKEAIEELGNSLSANKTSECTGKLKVIILDLKNKLLRTSNGANEFVELGGLQELVNVTKLCGRIKDSILGTAIGCLANVCALSKDARTKVASDDLIWFATLLKNTTSTKIFNCLARLIGNIAKDPENVLALQESQVLPELAKGLTICEDVDCKQSIIRALNILSMHKNCRKVIYDNEGFNALLQCLKSEDVKVTTAALMATESFLSSREPEFATELCTNGGMLAVVKLMTEQSKCFKPSLSIISVCVGMPECRGDVGTSGAIEALIKMSSDPQYNSFLPRMLIILCTSCNDVIGRQKMKDFGGLELLIAKLSDCEYVQLRTNILSAITHYYFDETTIRYMVERLDLHKTLVNCLSTADTADTSDKSSVHSSENEMSVDDPYSLTLGSPSSPASRSSTPASLQDDLSKDQISTFPSNLAILSYKAQNSLGSESSTSHAKTEESEKLAASFLSDDLNINSSSSSMPSSKKKKQPLHIDIINNTIHTPPNFVESILSSPQAYKSPLLHSPTGCYNYSSSYQVSLLLSRISLISQCQEFLASSETIMPILKHLCTSSPGSSYCLKILHRVLKNPKCFEKAIFASAPSVIWRDMCTFPWSEEKNVLQNCSENLQYISLESDERNVSEPKVFLFYLIKLVNAPPQQEQQDQVFVDYSTSLQYRGADLLLTLNKVAESPYGTGVLSSILLRGGCREKEACVSAIPFMCHSVQIVRRLMLDYDGLDILIDLVSNSDDNIVQQTAISSLVFLLQSVRSQSSLQHSYSKSANVNLTESSECQYVSNSGNPFDVEILVYPSGANRGGYKFSAHRELLAKLSDVFAAMLGGSFAESKSQRIVLKGVSPHAFLAILHHLYGCCQLCKQLNQESDTFLDCIWFDTNNNSTVNNCSSLKMDNIPSSPLEHDNLLSCIFPSKQEEGTEKKCYKEARQCLETLACANQFLLTNLCIECEERICECLPLDSSDIDLPSLFAYCQMHEAKIMPPLILDYILLRLGKPSLCSKLFAEILAGPSGHAAIYLMKSSIINAIRR